MAAKQSSAAPVKRRRVRDTAAAAESPQKALPKAATPAKGASAKNAGANAPPTRRAATPAAKAAASSRRAMPAAKGAASSRAAKPGAEATATVGAKAFARKRAVEAAAELAPPARKPNAFAATPVAVQTVFRRLQAQHPDAHCELVHDGPFQLLVATVLSAQTTDVAVNKLTPGLFERFPTAHAFASIEPLALEPYLSTIGMFRQKAKNVVGLARKLLEEFGGEVPRTLPELVSLPGVGRKTANVVLGVTWGTPEGVVVDTHVQRLTQRLGWSKEVDPPAIEVALTKLLPREAWDETSHVLIFHGRRVCFAKKPNCEGCQVNDVCPSAFAAELVGRKPARVRH